MHPQENLDPLIWDKLSNNILVTHTYVQEHVKLILMDHNNNYTQFEDFWDGGGGGFQAPPPLYETLSKYHLHGGVVSYSQFSPQSVNFSISLLELLLKLSTRSIHFCL